MKKDPIKYPIFFIFLIEFLLNLTMQALFVFKFYHIHLQNYVRAYRVCFCVYSGFYFIALLPYVLVGIGENNHHLFWKPPNDSSSKKARCLKFLQALVAIPLFLIRGIKFFKFRTNHKNFYQVIELHYVPVMSQGFILIPYLIIEGIFWGQSTHIKAEPDLTIDKSFIFFLPAQLLWTGAVAMFESLYVNEKYDIFRQYH